MKVTQKLRMRAEQAVFVGLGLAERLRHGQSIDLFSSAFRENPYAAFERVRDRGPIFYSLAIRAWWVTGFDLVREVLRDKRFSSDIRNFEEHEFIGYEGWSCRC